MAPLFSRTFPWSSSTPKQFILDIQDRYIFSLYIIASMFSFPIFITASTNEFLALAIVAEHSFFMKSKYPSSIQQSLKIYLKSNIQRNILQQITETFTNITFQIPSIIEGNSDYFEEHIVNPFIEILKNNPIP